MDCLFLCEQCVERVIVLLFGECNSEVEPDDVTGCGTPLWAFTLGWISKKYALEGERKSWKENCKFMGEK